MQYCRRVYGAGLANGYYRLFTPVADVSALASLAGKEIRDVHKVTLDGEIERGEALRIFQMHIGAVPHKDPNGFETIERGGDVKWRRAVFAIRRVDVGAVLQQKIDHFSVACEGRVVKSGGSALAAEIRVGAVFEEEFRDGGVTVEAGNIERAVAFRSRFVHVCAQADEHGDDLRLVVLNRVMQRPGSLLLCSGSEHHAE